MKKRRNLPVMSLPLPPDCPPESVMKVENVDVHGFTEIELKLGQLIRATYIRCRSLAESQTRAVTFVWRPAAVYDKGTSGSVETRKRLPIWPCVARWCLTNKIEAASYTTWRFVKAGLSRPPEPTQLISADSLQEFHKYRKRSRQAIKLSLRRQVQAFGDSVDYEIYTIGRTKYQAWAQVLSDNTEDLSPLFRYSLASSIGGTLFTQLASVHFSAAVTQYMSYPAAYKKHWSKLLDKKFTAKARANYFKILCGG